MTTIRIYRSTDTGGTNRTQVGGDFPDAVSGGVFSVNVPTTGWAAGSYYLDATAQDVTNGKGESPRSSPASLGVTAAGQYAISLDPTAHPGGTALVTTNSTDVSSCVSPTFSTSGPALLVAMIAYTGTGRTPITVSGGGLTWAQRVTSNDRAVIFTALAPSSLSSVAVTASFATARTQSMTLIALQRATTAATPVTATNSTGTTGTIDITLTPSTQGSWNVMVASVNTEFVTGDVVDRGDSTRLNWSSEALHDNGFLAMRASTPYSGSGPVTIGILGSQAASLAALEIIPNLTAPDVVGSDFPSTAVYGSATWNIPAFQANDIIAVIAGTGGSNSTAGKLLAIGGSGWNLLVNYNTDLARQKAVWWRRATGSGDPTTVTITDSGANDRITGGTVVLRGCNTGPTPLLAGAHGVADAGTPVTVPAVTTDLPNCRIILGLTGSGSNYSIVPTAGIPTTAINNSNGNYIFQGIQADVGSSGNFTSTWGDASTHSWTGVQIAARPATSGLAVMSTSRNLIGTTGNASITVTPPAATGSGRLLVAFLRQGSNQTDTPTVTDSAGGTWTLVGNTAGWSTSRAYMYYRANAPSVTSVTATFSTGGGVTRPSMVVYEIAGAATSSPLDTWGTATDTSTDASDVTTSITTTSAHGIILVGQDVGGDQSTWTVGTDFTLPSTAYNARDAMAYQVVSSIKTGFTTTVTWGTGGFLSQNIIAAFKAA